VAELLAEKGEHERADELVAGVSDRQSRARGWRELAAIHAKAGDVPGAEARVQRISEPAAFVEAMLQLADVPAIREELELRERFLRAALAAVKKVEDPQAATTACCSRASSRAPAIFDEHWPCSARAAEATIAPRCSKRSAATWLARRPPRRARSRARADRSPPFERATLFLAAARPLADRNN
jgi:hypothetical protein